VVVYLDNIYIYSNSRREYIRHIKLVLKALRKARLYIKLSKYEFFIEKTEFLGYIIGREGITIDPKKIEAIIE
jgi:hypothetical protein